MYGIFDVHTHTYPEILSFRATDNLAKFYNFTVHGKGTVSDLCHCSREAGITGFLILGVATNARQVPRVNEAVAADVKCAREQGFNAIGYAAMHQDTEDFAAALDYAESLGLCGIKIHPDIQGVDINDSRLLPLYRELEERGLPICFHMGDDREKYRYSEPKKLAEVLDMFPRLRVIAAHFGGYKSWDESIRYLRGRENVMYDASSALWAMTPEYARYLIDMLGCDKVMFGTDYPVMISKDYLELFNKIPLTDDEKEAILYKNAARFFRFDE